MFFFVFVIMLCFCCNFLFLLLLFFTTFRLITRNWSVIRDLTSKVAARHRSLHRITHTQRHLRTTTQRLIKSVYLLSPTQIVVNYIELPPNAMALSSAACPSKRHLHSQYVKLSERQCVRSSICRSLTHSSGQAKHQPAS